METVANKALAITDVTFSRLQEAKEPARALCRNHRKMLCLGFDAEGLDAAEYGREGFQLGQEVSRLNIDLLDLAASVTSLRILDACLRHGYCLRSDLGSLVLTRLCHVQEGYVLGCPGIL